ncbi:MAG: LamG domain-containing protein, partial [Armatimonadetes bacterium]|nr:LamG domain-containing protein [Armatimonadota bacterium]
MIFLAVAMLLARYSHAQDLPVLYVPFDGTTDPALSAAGVGPLSVGEVGFEAGMVGEGALIDEDCRYDVGGAFPVADGTFAAWILPRWAGDEPVGRTLMCIYGPEGEPDGWKRNRWSIVAGGGTIRFFIFPSEGGASREITASIAGWQPGEWHHLAVTWSGVGSATAAEMRLYLDGQPAAEAAGLDLQAGRPGRVLDIGRDSDASPDHAEAVYDEVFLYARPLTADEIRVAVERVRAGGPPRATRRQPPERRVEGWAYPALPYRAHIETVPQERERTDAWFETPLNLSHDLAQLGLPGAPDPGTFHLVDLASAREVACGARGDRLEFAAPGETPADATRRFALYFDAAAYEHVAPLLVAGPDLRPAEAHRATAAPNDYATATYGDAWDFEEGDTEAIDRFGDKPEYFGEVRVEDGVLLARVTQDPYLIWGSMWGPEDRGERRVRIEVEDHNLLEMRVRQSVGSAQ